MDNYNPVYPGLYYFDTFTFTTLGTSGHRGPESTKTYANAPWREGDFSIVDGQQQWTVPTTGTYRIEAAGAYGATPGRVVSGDVDLNEGQTVTMLVGQQPNPLVANVADNVTVGGGGGTFVTVDGKPLIVASGGDGTGGSAASFSPYGNGNGINGAGYLSNGTITNATFQFLKPVAYVDGGYGNMYWYGSKGDGGFGGGQSPVATSNISGGGGYTGSPGDGVSGATCYGAGTITDLGAASNTAGTVTISLIDPTPLKQKWTWDQTYTNTSPKVPVDVISWSDKRGIFESLTGSSTDGIHWDGATVYDLVKGQVSPSTFYSAYSDTLNLYIGFQFSIVNQNDVIVYVTSNDGITWTETTPIGLDILEVFGRFLWSSELNLFVIAGYGSIGSSYDGINWTERYSYPGAYFNVNSIAYSYSIHTFVCTADWDVIDNVDMGLYSTDGITWNTWSVTVSPQPTSLFRGVSVTWSPKLNIFIASVTYDALYSNIARSADGQTWTTSGSNDPDAELGWIVLWGEGLDVCTALSQPPGYTMYSYDAINWSVLFTSVTANHLAYSPSLKIFVPVEEAGFIQFISIDGIYYVNIAGFYPGTLELSFTWAPQIGTFAGQRYGGCISNNGVNWEETLTTYSDVCEWSPELGLYIALTFNNQIGPYLHSYYSSDGKTWTYTGGLIAEPTLPFDQLFVKPFVSWSPTLGVFSGSYYSRDGINWIQSLPDSSATAVGWSSFHGMFVAFHYTDVYYSYDGTTWTTGTNNTGVSGFGKIACSSSGRFVCQAGTIIPGIPFESSDEYVPQGVLYSDDGINWISPGVEFSLIAPIWVEELSIFVARANLFEDNDPTGWISSDGITWSAINIQVLSWSPELGRFLCPGGYSQVNNTF